ncbi:hypothetical protein NDN08_003095 [Rhodosorus marinus]|uniref:Metallo-beta-lactamase domain-containing protein n=1 Tax=Rhodosorus marinus TaxID=101924 RepID=A0AAV8UZ65_9RHOD|nr:hypothetical protein NDN08_003095 [Rhodosorus marinus]
MQVKFCLILFVLVALAAGDHGLVDTSAERVVIKKIVRRGSIAAAMTSSSNLASCIQTCKLLCSVFYEIYDLSWWACILGCPDKCGGGGGGGGGGVEPYGDPEYTIGDDGYYELEEGGVRVIIDTGGITRNVQRTILKDSKSHWAKMRKARCLNRKPKGPDQVIAKKMTKSKNRAQCIQTCKLLCSVFYEPFDLSWWACVLGCPEKCSGGGGGGGGGVEPYGDSFQVERRGVYELRDGGVFIQISTRGFTGDANRKISKDEFKRFRKLSTSQCPNVPANRTLIFLKD